MIKNCGTLIQKLATAIFSLSVMAFVAILIIEVSNRGIWDFGSLGTLVLIESLILFCGTVISIVLYGFGEIVNYTRDIRDLIED